MGGVVGYLYDSAKDAIKWSNLKPKHFVNLVMQVGQLVYLSDEDFDKISDNSDNDIIQLSDINNFAKMMQKIQTKG